MAAVACAATAVAAVSFALPSSFNVAFAPARMVVGAPVTDSYGFTWRTESGAVGGRVATFTANVAGTTNDRLYQRERYGMSGYTIPVGAPGAYRVLLREAEMYWNARGKRVFDITAEGRTRLSGVDIFARAGGKARATQLTFDVVVNDGTLNLGFVHRVDLAKVSSIQVTQVSTAAPALPVKPGPDNTGVPAGTVLKQHVGDINVTTPGAVLDAMDIHGSVRINAPNVRISRSIIRGGSAPTSAGGLVTSYGTANTGLLITDSELRPKNPSPWWEGAKVQNATLRRVEITGTTDGVGVHGDNVRVEDSWIHGMRHWTPFSGHSDNQTHNDAIQVHLGKGLRVVNSTVTGAHNAAVMITPNTGVVSDVQLVGNWLDNGGCTVNVAEKGRGAISGLVINDNRFGRNTRVTDCAVILPPATGAIATTLRNVWADTGTAVRIRTNGA